MSDFYLTLNSTFLKLQTDADIDKMGSQFELMFTLIKLLENLFVSCLNNVIVINKKGEEK